MYNLETCSWKESKIRLSSKIYLSSVSILDDDIHIIAGQMFESKTIKKYQIFPISVFVKLVKLSTISYIIKQK